MTLMRFLRYWLPGLICLSGLVVASVRGFDDTGLDAAGALIGAGSSLYLMNLLLRVGIAGDRDRDREDEARRFYDEHGMWPDEVPPGWVPPERAEAGDPAPPAASPPTGRGKHKAAPTEAGRHRGPAPRRPGGGRRPTG